MGDRLVSVDSESLEFPPAIQLALDVRYGGAGSNVVSAAFFGLAGDGVTDDTVAIQAAIDACPNHGTVIIPDGDYRMDGFLVNNGKSVHVSAYGARFITNTESRIVDFTGAWDATVAVSAASVSSVSEASGWNATVVLTVAGTMPWQRGDLVKLWADNILPDSTSDIPVPPTSAARVGQFFSVYSVATNQVVLMGTMRDPMTTAIKVARLQDITCMWSGGTFNVTDSYVSNDFVSLMFRFSAMHHPVVKDVTIHRAGGAAFSMVSNFGYRLENCEVSWAQNGGGHYGYGVDDNTSEFGVVDGCRFFQPRHGYTTTASGTNAGQDSPNIHGRTYGTKVINTLVDSSTSSAFDSHAAGSTVTFENCTAVNARFGFTLRGNRHKVLNCVVRDCQSGVRFSTDADAGNSFGHEVDGLRVEGTTDVVLETYLRGTVAHPQYNTRETRPSYFRNVTARNVVGRAFNLINSTVIIENVAIEFAGAVVSEMSNMTLSYLKGRNVRFELFDTTGTGADLIVMDNTLGLIDLDGVRIQGFSGLATRLARIVNAGTSQTLRLSNMLIDYAPSGVVYTPTTQSGWVDYQIAVGSGNASSNYLAMVDADVISATTVAAVGRSRAQQVIIDATLTGSNRTLANLPVPSFQGQELTVVNSSASLTLTVTHGGTPKTVLNGASSKVLTTGQALRLVGNSAGLWRQVTPV